MGKRCREKNMSNVEEMRERRSRLNGVMREADDFFGRFGDLDDSAYAEGALGKKHKELMGLAISVATRCDECILYHLDGCEREAASKEEIVETIKIGVVAGGSITMPNARFAFEALAGKDNESDPPR